MLRRNKIQIFIILTALCCFAGIINSIKIKTQARTDIEYTKITLDQSQGASCLDGTAPIFFWKQGWGSGLNNFIVYFEGGGWCYDLTVEGTIENCYQRSLTNMGSTKFDSDTATISDIFSTNQTYNPYFYNWNVAFVRYCDGTGHQGYKKDPVVYNNSNLYFRGNINTEQTFQMLLNNYNMKNAANLIVTGTSAGGLAVFNWINYIENLFQNKTTKILAAPDSGYFLDFENAVSQQYDYSLEFQNFMTLSNAEVDPINSDCVADYPNEKWKCMFAQYLVNYITVPLFFVQSPYDEWSLYHILGETCVCVNKFWSQYKCSAQQQSAIQSYKETLVSNITANLNNHKGSWGAWMPSCVFHNGVSDYEWSDTSITVPMNSNNTAQNVFTQWVQQQIAGEDDISQIYIDEVSWPDNTPCATLPGNFC